MPRLAPPKYELELRQQLDNAPVIDLHDLIVNPRKFVLEIRWGGSVIMGFEGHSVCLGTPLRSLDELVRLANAAIDAGL